MHKRTNLWTAKNSQWDSWSDFTAKKNEKNPGIEKNKNISGMGFLKLSSYRI